MENGDVRREKMMDQIKGEIPALMLKIMGMSMASEGKR
jgi:hypothetical protein